jgi:hypothetical protein
MKEATTTKAQAVRTDVYTDVIHRRVKGEVCS